MTSTPRHAAEPVASAFAASFTPRRAVAAGLAAAAIVGLTACSTSGSNTSTTAAPQTATVVRGSLSQAINAKGSLAASNTADLGFPAAGQIKDMKVHVGDHVTAGQVLATLDTAVPNSQLSAAKANLAAAQAAYDKADNSSTAENAQDAADDAGTVASNTAKQVDAAADADQVAIDNAKKAQDSAQEAVDNASNAVKAATAACKGVQPCPGAASAQQALAQAQAGLTQAKAAYTGAQAKAEVDQAAGKTAKSQASAQANNAERQADTVSSDTDYGLQQLEAAVDAAKAQVDIAQHNLDATTLKAPFEGTVTAVNGSVGEYVAPSTGTSALAPGSSAQIPGTNNAGGSAAAAAAAGSAVGRPGGTQLVVLSGTGPLQAVVPFQEMDAASLVNGQKVALTFDALPDLQASGTVKAVAPAGVAVGGSMSFYATIAVDTKDPRLKEGLSANAAVKTVEANNVLTLPSASIHAQDGQQVVTKVDDSGHQETVPVTTGVTDGQNTEIKTGLSEGDKVVTGATR